MISTNLPALQVVIPLLAAPACLVLRKPALIWPFAVLITWLTLAVSIGLLGQVQELDFISYHIGGWEPPWGIEYYVDALNAYVLLMISIIAVVVMLYAHKSVQKELTEPKQVVFYTAFLLCLAGLLGITITGDLFNVYVFLEISSLATYTLISLGSERRALTATFQYLIMGTLGATFILIGIGLVYVMTGTLNMQDLSQRFPEVMHTRTVHSAFAFLTVGICLKLALFPLHLWLPNAYAYAPSAVTGFVAATATKVAIYVLLRFVFTVFGAEFAFTVMPLGSILMTLASLAILVGSVVAIYQINIKRMLAYSSVAQIGYMVLGISLATVTGLTAGLLHMFNHALMKGGLFLALGAVYYSTGGVRIDNFRGLGKVMPWTMAAIVVGGLSLMGVPLTVGFVSKWYLVQATLEADLWPLAVLILVGSLISIVYIWRLVEEAYFKTAPEGDTPAREAPWQLLVPTWILIGASLYFGINTELTVGVATQAAESMLIGGNQQ